MYKKSITGGIILLFLLSSLIPMVSSDSPILNKTIYVDDDNTNGPWDGTPSQLKNTQHLKNYETKEKICKTSYEELGMNNHIHIDGYVINSNGDPYNYASVDLDVDYPNGSFGAGTFTDENGYFDFYFVPDKLLHETGILTASILNVSESVEVEITQNMSLIEIVLPVVEIPNGTICGYIGDLSMKPIEGVTIYETIRGLSDVTNEAGYYQIDDVTPGKLIFSFNAPGYKPPGKVHTGLIPGELKKWYNFTFPTQGNYPGGINGTVTAYDNGEAIVNAKMMIFVNGEIVTMYTDESGYYEFLNLSSNRDYLLIDVADGYCAIYEHIEVSSNVTTLSNFQLENISKWTRMLGFLFDNEGNPIEHGMFELSTEHGYSRRSVWGGGYHTGHFWQKPWPDSFHVKFTSEGYQTLEDDVSLPNPGVFVKHYMLTKNWTTESDSFTIKGFAGKEYDNQFTVETPNGSVLTDVEINLKWEDDVTYGLFKNKGLDTLSVEIQHNNESTSGSSEGTGNLTYWFLINDAPMDEMNVTGKNQTEFNIHIDVKTGEKIWRLLKFLKDKGNDFTLTFTYNYYIPNK